MMSLAASSLISGAVLILSFSFLFFLCDVISDAARLHCIVAGSFHDEQRLHLSPTQPLPHQVPCTSFDADVSPAIFMGRRFSRCRRQSISHFV